MRVAVLCSIALLAASESFAQTDRNGTLLVTVVDETRAVLPGANVTLAGTEAATKTAAALTAATNQQGQATFPNLPPGRYSVAAEFPGFQTRTLPDIRVRTGENKQAVMLPIDRLQSDVTVVARPAGRRVGSRRHVRERDDARTDRSAVGRPGRAAAAADRHRRPRRQDPRRQLRRTRPAAQGLDQVHPDHARPVRAGSPLRRRAPHRDPDPARGRTGARQRAHGLLRQRHGRHQSHRGRARSGAKPECTGAG